MPAEYLDANQPIVEIDPLTKELKATPYFEDYLYNIVRTIGGEGSTLISEIAATIIDSGKAEYLFALFKSIKRQLEDLDHYDGAYVLSLVKSLKKQVEEIEISDIHILQAAVRQIQVDTQGFIGKVITSDYTAFDKEWIEARNKARIYLPENALVNHQVIVSNGDGTIISVHGNGNNIKYTTTDTVVNIRNQGTSLHFQLFQDGTTKYWRIR